MAENESEQGAWKPVVLVLEDDRAINKVICRVCDRLGFRSIPVTLGEQALAVLETHRVDLLLTDLLLPTVSGAQVVARARSRLPRLPIVVMSGRTDFEPLVRGMGRNGLRFVGKPFQVAELSSALLATLEGLAPHHSGPPAANATHALVRRHVRAELLAMDGEPAGGIPTELMVLWDDPLRALDRLQAPLRARAADGAARTSPLLAASVVHTALLASSARALSVLVAGPDPDGTYLAGVFHRVGASHLARATLGRLPAGASGSSLRAALVELCGQNEPWATSRLLRAWGLPPFSSRTARRDDAGAHSARENHRIFTLRACAAAAERRGLGDPLRAEPLSAAGEAVALAGLGVAREDVARVMADIARHPVFEEGV